MKTLYEAPKMEVISFNNADIIVTSAGDNDTLFGASSATSLE